MPAEIVHDEETGVEGVFFQLEPDDPEYVLEVQRMLDPGDQDRQAGEDKVCLVYFGATAYGAITGWELEAPDVIRMNLTKSAATTLELPVENRFGCDDVDDIRPYYEKVREMLLATGELKG